MTTMKSQNFFNAFKTLKSQEDDSDCFSVAETKRKAIVLHFYGSLQLEENIHTVEFFANEDFNDYAEIVDRKDSGSINNYADYVLSLVSNFQNDERNRWKSHLNDFSIKQCTEPLPCSNDINCKNSKQALYNFQSVKLCFQPNEEVNYKINVETDVVDMPKKRTLTDSYVTKVKSVEIKETRTQNDADEQRRKESLFFRTARDELHIQNMKKFGKSGPTEKYAQPTVKKSLGTRKNGIFGKFQPPVKTSEIKENEIKMDVNEIVDERLKNIDPAMVELIKNEIMDSGSKITWDDIAGLHVAKTTIQEIVVWPMLRPDLFTGLRRPPRGILLFGPPGTGKTLIGKCIASQSNSTFFNISASSLTSKWVGDGEKMVRTLFAVAKVYQPSVVFVDEIDSLLTKRSNSDHECSRRLKTEFLVQLDGAGTGDEDRILIIGATNRPQELDEAARRRLVKRLYIPLPDEEARKQIIQNLISTERHSLTDSEVDNLAKLTKGYSGADVKNLCQEASLGPIRSIDPTMIQRINPEDVRPLNAKDFESALCRIKSSVSESGLHIYADWDKQYGCGSVAQII